MSDDDLEIPAFLRRELPTPEQRAKLLELCREQPVRMPAKDKPASARFDRNGHQLPRNIEPAGLAILAAEAERERGAKKR